MKNEKKIELIDKAINFYYNVKQRKGAIMSEDNYFVELNSVNVNDKIEKKNGLSYLAWAYAWGEIKKRHHDATYKVYENADGWNYFTDGRTGWVKTGVTVNNIEHIEYLPIMDFKNKSIPTGQITSFDVNKAVQRSLTKACARHGLGLYVYAGEDLPEETDGMTISEPKKSQPTKSLAQIISECNTEEELKIIWTENRLKIYGDKNLLELITEKGKELKSKVA